MGNEIVESQLSAYLDGELAGEELHSVETLLRDSTEHQQTLAELRSLSGAFRELPQMKLAGDFSSRVLLAAAAAEQALNDAPAGAKTHAGVDLRSPSSAHSPLPASRAVVARSRRTQGYVWATLASLAACVAIVAGYSRFNGPSEATVVATVETVTAPGFHVLRQSLPGEGEALVVRLRVPPGTSPEQALEAALAQCGITAKLPSEATIAGTVGAAYRTALRQQQTGADSESSFQKASTAMFVEAPLGLVEDAFATLADGHHGQLDFSSEMKVAVADLASGLQAIGSEGESVGASPAALVSGPFAQKLNPRIFDLPQRAVAAIKQQTTDVKVDPNQKVRMLILVETLPH